MTAALRLGREERRFAAISIAGEAALCDPRGALYLPESRMLIVSDLHLEKGSSFARRGALIPPYDTLSTLRQLQQVIIDHMPKVVVSLGDSFHDRGGSGRMPAPFRDQIVAMAAGRDWFWITGNHDPDAPDDLPGDSVQELAVGGIALRHEPTRGAPAEIAGHLHPCARIVQRGRSVRRRCFASDGKRLVMPAFGAYTGSLNMLDRAYAGLFEAETLMAYMLGDDRVYAFPRGVLRPG
ncbi:MAG: ligase-associated DNA damage response endonuclease PdeM [Rhizobiaceae bacterium]